MLKRISNWFKSLRKNDPLFNCDLYKDKGCNHVDGLFCDFPNCSMLAKYKEEKTNGHKS